MPTFNKQKGEIYERSAISTWKLQSTKIDMIFGKLLEMWKSIKLKQLKKRNNEV
jgi:hypothetical protein